MPNGPSAKVLGKEPPEVDERGEWQALANQAADLECNEPTRRQVTQKAKEVGLSNEIG